MKTTRTSPIKLAVVIAAALATFNGVDGAEARQPRPQPCRPGRYVIDGSPLTMGAGEVTVDSVKVDTNDGTASLGTECATTIRRYAGVRTRKRGRKSAFTVLRARGEKCGASASPIRIHARIDGLCDTMKGVLRMGKERVKFTAHRPLTTIDDCMAPEAPVVPIHTADRLSDLLLDGSPGSSLAAAFFAAARRYALGENPQSTLERDLYKRFASMGPDAQQLLSCAVHNYTFVRDLSPDASQIFSPNVVSSDSEAVTYAGLARGLSSELQRLVKIHLGWAEECSLAERAGFPRREYIVDPDGGIQNEHYGPRICEVKGIPTADYVPQLTYPELQERFTLEEDCSKPGCPPLQVDHSDECPGSPTAYGPAGTTKSYCYRVPWVQQGETVTLRGLNFRDTDIKVELRNKLFPTTVRTVDAHVCGDTTTPATEVVNGSTKTILDCERVQEQLSFIVPQNFTPGVYEVRVLIPEQNPLVGIESAPAYIRVLLPSQATYHITAEDLECVDPTNLEWGSDEVGILFYPTRVGLDGAFEQLPRVEFRDGNIDKGDVRHIDSVIASVTGANLGGLSVAMVGFERDNDKSYEEGRAQFEEAYSDYLQTGWKQFAEDAGSLAEQIAKEAGAGGWSKVIGKATEKAIHVSFALWAPADLIISDTIDLTNVRMSELTSVSYGLPPASVTTGLEGTKIGVEPIEKGPNYYRESRRYWHNRASSTYRLFFLHTRN